MIGHCYLIWAWKKVLASELAKDCPTLYNEAGVKVDDGKEKVYHIEFGNRNVKFPGSTKELGLLIVHGLGQDRPGKAEGSVAADKVIPENLGELLLNSP